MSGRLYVVGTPIGNLGDLSPRALEVLGQCDFIAAEDTRVTVKILNHFDIKKPLVSYHEHNRFDSGERIAQRIAAGEVCALVTDAGMPAISDPGEDLVRLCHERGIAVESVPGPCAFSTALAISGMPCSRFTFEGFLSVNRAGRREHLNSLVNEARTMVFYEAPHKLASTLRDMYEAFGERNIAIVREITKIHEQVIRVSLSEAAARYSDGSLKGEMVIIVEGARAADEEQVSLNQAAKQALELVEHGMARSEAAKLAAKKTGLKKNDIYRLLNGGENDA